MTSEALTTAALTVITGVLIYTIGQLILKFIIEPRHVLSKLRGEIAESLIFYANVYANPGTAKAEMMDEASNVLRKQASQLTATMHLIPLYGMLAFLRCVPKRDAILEARENLVGLSNSIHGGAPTLNIKRRRIIAKQLDLHIETE